MTTPLEKAARALCRLAGDDPDARYTDRHGKTRDFPNWHVRIDEARAVIMSLMENDEAMDQAATQLGLKVALGPDYSWPQYMADLRRAMLRKALGE